MSDRLYKELSKYSEGNVYPFHMPGHKRNMNSLDMGDCALNDGRGFLNDAYKIDITEIDGFDNLHDAKGLIKEAEENAAKLYKSEETHFLVNGSSCGVLSAIFSVTNKGDKVIVARNCHKSVYNAIYLNELNPIFIYPEDHNEEEIAASIYPKDIEKAILENRDAKAVIFTSPTYDGIISDVASICKIAHEFDIPVIVDEAHGALFYLEGRSAVINNADIVINSVHKTLPALTGTALIHVNGKLVDRDNVKKYLSIFQTSSPSYVLMASIDYAMEIMETKGIELYRNHCIRLFSLKESIKKLRLLKYFSREDALVAGAFDFDESKVIISTLGTELTGKKLSDILLKEYGIQCEMATKGYALLMLTVMDSDEGIERLKKALLEIDDNIASGKYKEVKSENRENTLKTIIGNKSDKTVYVYPPGIPIIIEGETVTQEVIDKIDEALKAGLDVKGL